MAEDSPDNVAFHYIKTNSFQVVHADGVWGGPTPRGYISMSFYSERHPIPQKIVHQITPQDTLGKEIDRDAKDGIVREVGVEVLIDLPMAKSLVPWLKEKIASLENKTRKTAKEGA